MTAPTVLHHLLDRTAAWTPDAPALGQGVTVTTYRELDAASRRLGDWLVRHGVRRGDRVVVAAPADPSVPALLYGCSRAGAVFAVLHEQAPAPAVAHVLDDCTPALVVADDPDVLRLAAERDVLGITPAELRAVTDGDPAPAVTVLPVDPVCLIYTSGSTGAPKAVVSTHAQAVFAVTAIQSQLAYRADDVVYCALPLAFDYGLYQLFLGTLAGARVQLASPRETGPQLLRNLHDCGATVLPSVPGLAAGLARMLSRPGARSPALRLLTNTGAAMPPAPLTALRRQVPGLRVQLMFGLTECKRATIMPPDEDLRRPGACGRALPGTEVFTVDEAGRRLGPGQVGQVVVRGPHVMAGYWRRPELTAQRFPRGQGLFPELRTGDYGWLDEDGYLYFHGRRDDLYKERGFRVSVTEVEAAAQRVPGVDSAGVLAPVADGAGATLLAVTELAPHEVLEGLRAELEDFKVPRRCLVVREIPVTRNGKIDRAALARLATEAARA